MLVDRQRAHRHQRPHRGDRCASPDVAAGFHCGVTIATYVPADHESKGGSEATVRIAKADLVPTEVNLRDDYRSWAELVEACDAFMTKVNGREHRITRRVPAVMLSEERSRLQRLPAVAYTAAFARGVPSCCQAVGSSFLGAAGW